MVRDGECIQYLDSILDYTDEENAFYYIVSYRHNWQDMWTMDHKWNRKKGLVMNLDGNKNSKRGLPIALNGHITWFDKKGNRKVGEEHFENGHPVGQTISYNKDESIHYVFDYEKKWQGMTWSLYEEIFRKGEVEKATFLFIDTNDHKWKYICTIGCYVSKDLRITD